MKGATVEGMRDKVEGKLKEAEGKLTDDELREKQGQAQQKVGEGKEQLETRRTRPRVSAPRLSTKTGRPPGAPSCVRVRAEAG